MIVGGWLPGRPGADKEPRARDKMWADLRGAENSCWGHRGHRRLCSSQHRALLTFTLVNTICLWLNMKRCGKVGSRIKCTHVRNIYPVTSRMWVDIISIYSVWNCENISNSEWDMPPHCCMKLLENVLVDRLTAAVTTWSCAESEDDGHTDTRLQLSFVARQQSAAIHSGQFTAAI